jgi:hypothetical protein
MVGEKVDRCTDQTATRQIQIWAIMHRLSTNAEKAVLIEKTYPIKKRAMMYWPV